MDIRKQTLIKAKCFSFPTVESLQLVILSFFVKCSALENQISSFFNCSNNEFGNIGVRRRINKLRKPGDFMINTFPNKIRFAEVNSVVLFSSYEKYIPRILTGSLDDYNYTILLAARL